MNDDGLVVILALSAAVSLGITYTALKMLKKGSTEITEAAQELNNRKLHEAGNNLNKGFRLLLILFILSFAIMILGFSQNLMR